MPQVREAMSSEVVTIESSTGIVEAAQKMIQQEKGPLPVVEGDRPVAIVTDRDIIARVVTIESRRRLNYRGRYGP